MKKLLHNFRSLMVSGIFQVILIGICFISIPCNALEVTPEFRIVKGKFSGLPSESSVTVLSEHLEKIFGKKLTVVSESEYDGKTPAIVLAEASELDKEEWNIRAADKNLLISGGYPRGLYYGVCEFLEKFCGVRWFSARDIYIPQQLHYLEKFSARFINKKRNFDGTERSVQNSVYTADRSRHGGKRCYHSAQL